MDEELVALLSKAVDTSVVGLVSKGVVAKGDAFKENSSDVSADIKRKVEKENAKTSSKFSDLNERLNNIDSTVDTIQKDLPSQTEEVLGKQNTIISMTEKGDESIKDTVKIENNNVVKTISSLTLNSINRMRDYMADTFFLLNDKIRRIVRNVIFKQNKRILRKLEVILNVLLGEINRMIHKAYESLWPWVVGGILIAMAKWWDEVQVAWAVMMSTWLAFKAIMAWFTEKEFLDDFGKFLKKQLRKIAYSIAKFKRNILGHLMKLESWIIKRGGLAEIVKNGISKVFSKIGNSKAVTKIKDMFTWINKLKTSVLSGIQTKFPKMASMFTKVSSFFGNIKKGLIDGLNGVAKVTPNILKLIKGVSWFVGHVTGLSSLKHIVNILNPLVAIVKFGGGAAFKILEKLFFVVTKAISMIPFLGKFMSYIPLLGQAILVFNALYHGVKTFFNTEGTLAERLKASVISMVVETVDYAVTSIVKMLVTALTWSAQWVLKKFGFEDLANDLDGYKKKIFGFIDGFMEWLKNSLGHIINSVSSITTDLIDAVSGIWDSVVTWIQGLTGLASGLFKVIFGPDRKHGAKEMLIGLTTMAEGFIGGVYGTLTKVLNSLLVTVMGPILDSAFSMMFGDTTFFTDMFKSVKRITNWLFDGGFFDKIKLVIKGGLSNMVANILVAIGESSSLFSGIKTKGETMKKSAEKEASILDFLSSTVEDSAKKLKDMTNFTENMDKSSKYYEMMKQKLAETTEYYKKDLTSKFDATSEKVMKNVNIENVDALSSELAKLTKDGYYKTLNMSESMMDSMKRNLEAMKLEAHSKITNSKMAEDLAKKIKEEDLVKNAKSIALKGIEKTKSEIKKLTDMINYEGVTDDAKKIYIKSKEKLEGQLDTLQIDFSKKYKDLSNTVKEKMPEYKDQASSVYQEAKTMTGKGIDMASEVMDDATVVGREVLSTTKEKINGVNDDLQKNKYFIDTKKAISDGVDNSKAFMGEMAGNFGSLKKSLDEQSVFIAEGFKHVGEAVASASSTVQDTAYSTMSQVSNSINDIGGLSEQ